MCGARSTMAFHVSLVLLTLGTLLLPMAARAAVVRSSAGGAPPTTSATATYQCSAFSNAFCNGRIEGVGYNRAVFPNPLAPSYLPNVQTAQEQANIYIPLADASGCSRSVVKFLCFSYFPLCLEGHPSAPFVLPCASFCRSVKANCEQYLRSRYATAWPQWLDCDRMGRAGGLCINETELPAASPTTTAIASSSAVSPTAVPPTAGSTPTPPVTTETSPYTDSDCGVCSPRSNVSSGTFRVAVNNYTMAAKVIIESRAVINHVITYTVTVLGQYLPICSNSVRMPKNGTLISTYPEQCSPCFDMQLGQTYVIGGYYYLNPDGGVTWQVPRKRGVVALWVDKYDFKLDNWMTAAANDRPC